MNRYLINQMAHEWRSNLWLIVELMLVTAIVAYLLSIVVTKVANFLQPRGFEEENVYMIDVRYLSPGSVGFHDFGDDEAEENYRDVRAVLERLRLNPSVEAAAISSNASPYNDYQLIGAFMERGSKDSIVFAVNMRSGSPDIVRVLRVKSIDGVSREELERRMRAGEVLITENQFYEFEKNISGVSGLVGKELTPDTKSPSLPPRKVGGVIMDVSGRLFEKNIQGSMFVPIDEEEVPSQPVKEILVRVKEGFTDDFIAALREDFLFRYDRNVYVAGLRSLSSEKRRLNRVSAMEIRTDAGIVFFILGIVFSGLLGTFWFRVQQRSGEIALRIVHGAPRRAIMSRLLSEGTLLLTAGFAGGLVIVLLLWEKYYLASYSYIKLGIFRDYPLVILTLALTWIVMEIMVVAGIMFPARRAMRINPAEALKEE